MKAKSIAAPRKNRIKQSTEDTILDIVVYTLTALVVIITIYPLFYIASMSISDPFRAARGEVYLLPKGFSLTAFKRVLSDSKIFVYYGNTIYYTVAGTIFGIVTTILAAYPLSRKQFRGRTPIALLFTLTMFLHAGLIPNYILIVKFLNLYGSRWSQLLPGLTSAWYIIITRTFFMSLPEELFDSAKIDGASEFQILRRVALPLSKPVLAVLTVHFGVGHWNSYMPAMLYLSAKEKLQPLALYIRRVVVQGSVEDIEGLSAETILSQLQLKYVVIVVAVLPLMLMYPIFGKYMKKGLMVGSLKG